MKTTNNDLLTAAINIGLVTPLELLQWHQSCGSDENIAEVFDTIDEWASALQHSDPKTRAKWFHVRDAHNFFHKCDSLENDRFGFKADAYRIAVKAFAACGVELKES